MKNNKKYNIGLDIGVGSVGWCVTDEENNILKKGNKHMWGSRIFAEASTAANRRTLRSARRRLSRRKERLNMLKDIMNEDMEKEYPNFFKMLSESSLVSEDKIEADTICGIKYNLFSINGETDKEYFNKYPTIYHLRHELINTKEKVDIRLVYLALHHIIKYRGNFLYDGDFENNTSEIEEHIENIISYLRQNDINTNNGVTDIIKLLQINNLSRTERKEKFIELFVYNKTNKNIITNIVNAILGSKFELNKIFELPNNLFNEKICFSSEIENEELIHEQLGEYSTVYNAMFSVYSWFTLQDILKGEDYISVAFKNKYNKYCNDLKLLKNIYKKYMPEKYNSMFRKVEANNYASYNGKNKGKKIKKCKEEDFFKRLKNEINELPEHCEEKQQMLKELNDEDFLRKINVTDNGAIPHQLHELELNIILENQSKYYKTLSSENIEKIKKIFNFRIPYYVGPLSKGEEKWSWIVRKNNQKIYPWNFEEIIDVDLTAEKFIRKMTNKCTYLLNEDVIPKNSLLYSKFCVLNEINNLTIINGKNTFKICKELKQNMINDLFEKNKKVTIKRLKEFLKKESVEFETIEGFSSEEGFISSLSSYIDMKNIFGNVDEERKKMYEDLIYWITIFEDKKILKRKILKHYPNITEEQLKKISKLNYTGWSRLSKKLLEGIKSNDYENIMQKLENTSFNFMQIINNKQFGFDKKLEELLPTTNGKIKYEDVEEIPTSPANKRAIWQSLCVVKEIEKVMKCKPENIFIEFARNEEEKGKKNDNRAKQLLKKYEEIEKQLEFINIYDKKIYKDLKQKQNEKDFNDKLYLYFIQNGKCMYSGRKLELEDLNNYEIDHIIPRTYIKDDSIIDNKVLVYRKENQNKKDNLLLNDKIIDKMEPFWKFLFKSGLITQNKYFRLIRREMFSSNADREKFIQRQLVETRQITKYVANLLKNIYNECNIYTIRAELTSGFREHFEIYKNRDLNNLHHAHDAYIVSIIGNAFEKEWHGTEKFKYSEYVKKYIKEAKDNLNFRKEKWIMLGFVEKRTDINKVYKYISYNDCFISRMLEENTGEFYHQTLYGPNTKATVSLKENKPIEKYGGYSNEFKSYLVIYAYEKNKKYEYELIGIPIYVAYDIKNNKYTLEDYIINNKLLNTQYKNLKIIKNHIFINQQFLDNNGNSFIFCSDSEIKVNKELLVDNKINKLIYFINNKKIEKSEEEKIYRIVYEYLINKLNKEYGVYNNICDKVNLLGNTFFELKLEDKKSAINGLISLMKNGNGNLKILGLGDRAGRMSGKSFKTEKILNMVFIDKSVTGMYERRYKINGMENCNSK